MILKVALVGIGGFGSVHADNIIHFIEKGRLECIAFAEINPNAHKEKYDALINKGAIHYKSYEEMLVQHPEIDFVVIPTPIPLHKPMSIYTMEKGFHVLLEKPPAVTIQDINEIINTQHETGKLCQVNFQHTSKESFRMAIKKLNEGCIGELKKIKAIGKWNRTLDYYERTPWAGKLIHQDQYVLDGTLNNPLAHLLNNSLIAAGYGDASLAEPQAVQAECYKANPIDGEDTVCARIRTKNQIEILFYTTLCHSQEEFPSISMEGTRGMMKWSYDDKLIIQTELGEEKIVLDQENSVGRMYENLMESICENKKNSTLYSPIEACRSFVLATNGAFESSKQTHNVPEQFTEKIQVKNTHSILIKNISEIIDEAANNDKLFSEMNVKWAIPTQPFSLIHYDQFSMFK